MRNKYLNQLIGRKPLLLLSRWIFKQRVKIIVLFLLLLLRELLFRVPYVNVVFALNIDIIDIVTIPLLVMIFARFNGRKLILFPIVLFIPTAILTLLGNLVLAEKLANIAYVSLLLSILIMFVNYLKKENA